MSANPELIYRFLDLVRFLHGPCLLVEASGRVVRATKDFARIAPIEPDQSLMDLVESDAEGLRSFLRQAARSVDPIPGALHLRGKDGPVRCQASRFGDRFGETLVFVHVPNSLGLTQRFMAVNRMLEDLEAETQRRRVAEQERLQMERAMLHGQKLESLGVLAGGIAHDFNNMLVGILANVEHCIEELPPTADHLREPLVDVRRSAHHAADLCRQMLAFAGRGKFLLHDLQVGNVVRETVDLLRTSISSRCELVVDVDASLWVRADPSQLHQVIMNLVINASEALRERPGTVRVHACAVESEAFARDARPILGQPQGSLVQIAVEDDGAGMDPQTLDRIFDPFFTTKDSNRGLGLAAVAGVVRAHRGGLAVRSRPGGGSTFTVAFPRIDAPSESVAVQASPSEPDAVASGAGLILVVDDDPLVRRVAARVLTHDGFDVVEASDGLTALQVFDADSNRIVAVLLDLTMPKLGGHAVLQALSERNARVPVVVSSGYTDTQLQPGQLSGPVCFLAKPFTPSALRQALQEVLSANALP